MIGVGGNSPRPFYPINSPQASWQPSESNDPNLPKEEHSLSHLSQYTLENGTNFMKGLNLTLANLANIATVLHGGAKIRGLRPPGKSSGPGWYEPHKFPGLLPGIYNPKRATRRHFLDVGLALGCTWNIFDSFGEASAESGSLGIGVAAGVAESLNQFGFNFFYAEPIIYRTMDTTMILLGKLFPKSQLHQINQEIAGKVPRKIITAGIPMSYRLTRSLVAGTAGLLVLNALLEGFSRWLTPAIANVLGPALDQFFPGRKSRPQGWTFPLMHHPNPDYSPR